MANLLDQLQLCEAHEWLLHAKVILSKTLQTLITQQLNQHA